MIEEKNNGWDTSHLEWSKEKSRDPSTQGGEEKNTQESGLEGEIPRAITKDMPQSGPTLVTEESLVQEAEVAAAQQQEKRQIQIEKEEAKELELAEQKMDAFVQQGNPKTKKKLGIATLLVRFRQETAFRKIRMILVFLINVLAYLFAVFQLFFQERLLYSMVPLLIFFVVFHFAILEIRRHKMRRVRGLFCLAAIVEMLLLWFKNWQVPVTVIVFNLGIIFLGSSLKWASGGRRKFSPWGYFTAGAYIFSMFMTVSYSLFLIGGKGNFDLSCTNIQESSDSFVDTMMTPFTLGKKQMQILGSGAVQLKESIADFFSSDVDDVVETVEKVEIIPVEDESLGDKIIWKFSEIKTNISTAVDENTKVSLWICDLILKKIEKLYEHPGVQFAIVFLMWLLLYPFVRIAFWIVTAIGFALFKLLYLLRVYRKKKVVKEVEEVV